jgi:hypothetical protein
MASESEQLVIDQYDFSSDDEEYLIFDNVVETSTKQKEHTALYLTAARNYLNSPCKAAMIRGQINTTLNNVHSDAMEISITFWIPDITD